MSSGTSTKAGDDFDPDRFVVAQDRGGAYGRALTELRAGRKTSHWMWFVFPQLAGVGRSEMARYYALSGVSAASAYLGHPVLGPRLIDCVDAVLAASGSTAEQMLGQVDALKLRSSMTLFMRANPVDIRYREVIDQFFGGAADPATDDLLGHGVDFAQTGAQPAGGVSNGVGGGRSGTIGSPAGGSEGGAPG